MEYRSSFDGNRSTPKPAPSAPDVALKQQPGVTASQPKQPSLLSRAQLVGFEYITGCALLLFGLIAAALSVAGSYNLLYKGTGLIAGAFVILYAHQAGKLRWCLRSGFLILYAIFTFLSIAWMVLNPVAFGRLSTIIIFFGLTTVVFIYVAATQQVWPIFYGFLGGVLFIFVYGGGALAVVAAEEHGARFFYSIAGASAGEAMNPNAYGFLLNCLLLLSLKILFVDEVPSNPGLKRLRLGHCACAIFGGILSIHQTITATGSRKALVLVLVACGGTGVLYLARRFSFTRLLIGATASAVSVGLAWTFLRESAFFQRFLTLGEIVDGGGIEESSSLIRADMAQKGIAMWLESPVWGHGIDYFQYNSGFHAYTHSTPIEILVSMGLIGALLFYAAMFTAAKGALATFFSGRARDKAEAAWVLLLSGCLAFSQMTSVVAFGHMRDFAVIIGVVAASSYGMRRENTLKRLGSHRPLAAAAGYRCK